MAHLTGKARFATSFRKIGEAGNVDDILERKIPEEKLRELDKVSCPNIEKTVCSPIFKE